MEITQDERYLSLTDQLQEIARSIAVYGLHVHVGVDDRDQSIELMNEARYFLPHILALSVNSPMWEGRDTGIQSYRSVIWGRMPRTGIPDHFASWANYQQFVDTLLCTNSIDEPKKIWWDIRPHPKFNTLEFRVCDMPSRVDETIALAALFQAIICKLTRLRAKNLGFRTYQRALLSENRWRAMRFGLNGSLIDFGKGWKYRCESWPWSCWSLSTTWLMIWAAATRSPRFTTSCGMAPALTASSTCLTEPVTPRRLSTICSKKRCGRDRTRHSVAGVTSINSPTQHSPHRPTAGGPW
jgi:gamma-glutamyl:cysteine ligase YbdK (ATP-grasp superfamily)